MNFLSYILAGVILALSLTPCSDVDTCSNEDLVETHGHDPSQEHEDHCTPFCTCLCCGSHITSIELAVLPSHITLIRSRSNNFYSLEYSSLDFNSIWQPPKFS
jgi:hypothetical protein